jgi:predicted permease
METFWQDLKYGTRMLAKNPGFTAVVVLSLALGIGANTTIFTLINAVFLNPLPIEDSSRVVLLYTTDEINRLANFTFLPTSYPNYVDYRDKNDVLAGLALYGFTGMSLTSGSGEPEQITAYIVTGNYFDVLGVKMARGRGFLPDEDKTLGTHPVAVVSHGLWKRRFGSDLNLLGQSILLNGRSYTVVGIAPVGFRGTNALGGPEVWVPLAMRDQVLTGVFQRFFNERRTLLFFLTGRLKPGVSLEQAQAAMKTLARQLEQEYPKENEKRSITVVPIAQAAINPNQRGDFVRAGALLMSAVGLVLLIACANVGNLLLARATRRQREIAIRISLGASRGRLVRQLLTESILMAVLAGVTGLLVAYWGRDLLWSFRPPFFNANAIDLTLNSRVLFFTLGVSLLTGILFGLIPALQASRPDLATSLKDRTNPPSGTNHWYSPRNVLVMAQVSLSLIALVAAGLFLRSLGNAQRINPGFDTQHLLVMSFNVGAQGYNEQRAQEFYRQVTGRLKSLPIVQSAAIAANPPFGGGFARTVFPESADASDRRSGKLMLTDPVQPDYFDTIGTPILRGRRFTEDDRAGAPFVAIVNETMAKLLWPNQEAIGKRIRFFGETWIVEIVGIARDSKYVALGEDPLPMVYLPLYQHHSPAVTLYVRTAGDPATALGVVRGEVQALERRMPLVAVATMPEVMAQSLWAPRMGAALLGIFGGLALVLAAVGIYGVMSYSVGQRTQEIGIRMALGAQDRDVLGLVLRQGMLVVAIGLGLGLAGALALTNGLSRLLFDVGTSDPVTYAGTAVVLVAVALVACYIPARRASRVDPMVALRYE